MAAMSIQGVPLEVHDAIPIGNVYRIDLTGTGEADLYAAERLTVWRLIHPGREPMLSRCSRGMLELDRERRRR